MMGMRFDAIPLEEALPMELDFHRRFHPLTATPLWREDGCVEAAPCAALAPYVRCLWGHRGRPVAVKAAARQLVIPDACADILLRIREDGIDVRFSALDQQPYWSGYAAAGHAVFAARFYFWALPAFSLSGATRDDCLLGLERDLSHSDFAQRNFAGRQAWMEAWLLHRLADARLPETLLVLVHELLQRGGNVTVRQLAGQGVSSVRTVERMFRRHLDATPKELAGVVRYQTLWSHVLRQRHWDIQDEVEALGFYDQAHLANTFRRYHGMSLAQGIRLAQPVSRFSKTEKGACGILEAQTAKGEGSHGTTPVF